MKLGYARLSSEAQNEGQSLEVQQDRLHKAGCDRIYSEIESGWKGRKGQSSDRIELQRLISEARDLRSQDWPVEIVFARLDRWARHVITSMSLIEELESDGITLRSLDSGVISVATAEKWLEAMQQSVFNEYYSRRISSDVKRSYDYKRSTGKPLQHKQPFGWQLSADKTQLEPNTAIFKETNRTYWELARELVEFYLAGNSLTALADHAAKLGIPLSGASAHRWLVNPIHQGHTWWYKKQLPKGVYRNSSNNEREIIYNTHAPLITSLEWAQIQQRLKDGKQNWGVNASRGLNVLQGLCVCSDCGRKLKRNFSPTTANPNYMIMRCFNNQCPGKSYPFHKIEQALIEAIVEKAYEIAKKAIQPVEEQKPPELIALEKQRADILGMLAVNQLEGLQLALEEIQAKISKLKSPAPTPASRQDMVDMAALISNPESYESLTLVEKRFLFSKLCSEILVKASGPLDGRGVLSVTLTF